MEKTDIEHQPILEDFAVFLTFIHSRKEIPATLQLGHLKQKDLFRLNQEMHYKADWVTEKSMQPSYPELEFFYEVALASGILQLKASQNKEAVLAAEEGRLSEYNVLSAVDQYFFFLETAWRYLNWESITDSPAIHFHSLMDQFISFLTQQQPGKAIDVKNKEERKEWNVGYFSFDLYHKVVQIFSFLGFCGLEPDTSLTKKPDKFTAPFRYLTVTPLGAQLDHILAEKFPFQNWNILTRKRLHEDDLRDFSLYRNSQDTNDFITEVNTKNQTGNGEAQFLEAFSGEHGVNMALQSFYKDVNSFKAGNYLLQIGLTKEISRTIRFNAEHTLEDVHLAIQDAYKFENDHLYAFYLNTGLWTEENYFTPESDMGQATDSVKLGELNLITGQRFVYLFDFGDEWQFVIDVLEIDETSPEVTKPKLVGKTGRAPKQYGY
jgi:hypothetical protein